MSYTLYISDLIAYLISYKFCTLVKLKITNIHFNFKTKFPAKC